MGHCLGSRGAAALGFLPLLSTGRERLCSPPQPIKPQMPPQATAPTAHQNQLCSADVVALPSDVPAGGALGRR